MVRNGFWTAYRVVWMPPVLHQCHSQCLNSEKLICICLLVGVTYSICRLLQVGILHGTALWCTNRFLGVQIEKWSICYHCKNSSCQTIQCGILGLEQLQTIPEVRLRCHTCPARFLPKGRNRFYSFRLRNRHQ